MIQKSFIYTCIFMLGLAGAQPVYPIIIPEAIPQSDSVEKNQLRHIEEQPVAPALKIKRSLQSLWEKIIAKRPSGRVTKIAACLGVLIVIGFNIFNKVKPTTKDPNNVFDPINLKVGDKELTTMQKRVPTQIGNTCGANATKDSELIKNVLVDPTNPKVYSDLQELDPVSHSIIYDRDGPLRTVLRERFNALRQTISNDTDFYNDVQIAREKNKIKNGQASDFVEVRTIQRGQAPSVDSDTLNPVEWQKVTDYMKEHPGTSLEQASIALNYFFVRKDNMIPYDILSPEQQEEIRAYHKEKKKKNNLPTSLHDNPNLRAIDQDSEGIELNANGIETAIGIFKDHGKIDPASQIRIYSNLEDDALNKAAIQEIKQNGIHQIVLGNMISPASCNKGGADTSQLGHWTSLVIKRDGNKVIYAIGDSLGNPDHSTRPYLLTLLECYESPEILAAYKKELAKRNPGFLKTAWHKITNLL